MLAAISDKSGRLHARHLIRNVPPRRVVPMTDFFFYTVTLLRATTKNVFNLVADLPNVAVRQNPAFAPGPRRSSNGRGLRRIRSARVARGGDKPARSASAVLFLIEVTKHRCDVVCVSQLQGGVGAALELGDQDLGHTMLRCYDRAFG